MNARIHPWADVVDDSAIRQGFFDPLMIGVIHKLETAAGRADWGVLWQVDMSTCGSATCDLVGHVPAVPSHGSTCACGLVAVGVVGVNY